MKETAVRRQKSVLSIQKSKEKKKVAHSEISPQAKLSDSFRRPAPVIPAKAGIQSKIRLNGFRLSPE